MTKDQDNIEDTQDVFVWSCSLQLAANKTKAWGSWEGMPVSFQGMQELQDINQQ